MTVVRRPSSQRVNGRPVMRYQVRWKYQGKGAGQSKTVDNNADAKALNAALKAIGWDMLDTDPTLLTLIGMEAPEEAPLRGSESRQRGTSFGQAAEQWLAGLVDKADATATQYGVNLSRVGEEFSSKPLANITETDVRNLLTSLQRRYKPNTMKATYQTVKAVLLAEGLTDVVAPLVREKVYKGFTELDAIYLTRDQVNALVTTAEEIEPRMALMIRFMALTGLRIGETIALRARYIRPDTNHVDVKWALKAASGRGGGFRPEPTKGRRERAVPLFQPLDKVMAAHVADMPADAVVFAPDYADWWTHKSVLDAFRRVCAATPGVPDEVRLHDLRHTAAKRWLDEGMQMRAVSKFLGHASVTITEDTYGKFDKTSTDAARLIMDDTEF